MHVALVCSVDSPTMAEVVSMHLFDSGAAAIGEESLGDHVVLTAGFGSVKKAEQAAVIVSGLAETRIEETSTDWEITQRKTLEPILVRPFRIRGPWHARFEVDNDSIDLEIDPGPAFGHGGHPSTVLLLAMLPDIVRSGLQVMDLGTGSGVLAVAAAKLGANVVAVEIDPAAAASANENLVRNRVSDRVQVVVADATSVHIDTTCVIANVTIDVHRGLAPCLQSVRTLLLAGILDSQTDETLSLYPTHRPVRNTRIDGWTGLWLESSEDAGV